MRFSFVLECGMFWNFSSPIRVVCRLARLLNILPLESREIDPRFYLFVWGSHRSLWKVKLSALRNWFCTLFHHGLFRIYLIWRVWVRVEIKLFWFVKGLYLLRCEELRATVIFTKNFIWGSSYIIPAPCRCTGVLFRLRRDIFTTKETSNRTSYNTWSSRRLSILFYLSTATETHYLHRLSSKGTCLRILLRRLEVEIKPLCCLLRRWIVGCGVWWSKVKLIGRFCWFLAGLFWEGKFVFGLLLRVQMTKTDIVNAQFEVFTVLHHAKTVVQHGKRVHKWALKLLFVRYQDSISQNSSPPTQFTWKDFYGSQVAFQLQTPSEMLFWSLDHVANVRLFKANRFYWLGRCHGIVF